MFNTYKKGAMKASIYSTLALILCCMLTSSCWKTGDTYIANFKAQPRDPQLIGYWYAKYKDGIPLKDRSHVLHFKENGERIIIDLPSKTPRVHDIKYFYTKGNKMYILTPGYFPLIKTSYDTKIYKIVDKKWLYMQSREEFNWQEAPYLKGEAP